MSQLHSKQSAKAPPPREFPGYWWQFRTQHFSRYSAIDWLKKEKRWKILIFGCFRFAPLKRLLLYVAITTVDWGNPFKLLWVLLDAIAFAPRWWYRHDNANTLIGAIILKSGHSYIWARYCEPIILTVFRMKFHRTHTHVCWVLSMEYAYSITVLLYCS